MPRTELKRQSAGFISLAILLVLSAHALPAWIGAIARHFEWPILELLGRPNLEQLTFLLFSIVLICHDPAGYGLRIGNDMRKKWPWVLLICIIPVLVTAVCYPLLPSRPFSGATVSTWLISPLAEDILFAGFLYKGFSIHFPGMISRRLPAERCIILTAACFSLAHLPNIAWVGSFVWLQLAYTFLGACLVGVIR